MKEEVLCRSLVSMLIYIHTHVCWAMHEHMLSCTLKCIHTHTHSHSWKRSMHQKTKRVRKQIMELEKFFEFGRELVCRTQKILKLELGEMRGRCDHMSLYICI